MSNYGTAIGLTDYATARGVTLDGDPDVLLTRAHDYLESLDYIGVKSDPAQDDQWPRDGAYVDGVELDDATVPTGIVNAEYTVAIAIDQGYDPMAVRERKTTREKVDVLEVEYSEGSSSIGSAPGITASLRKYLRGGSAGSGATQFEVIR